MCIRDSSNPVFENNICFYKKSCFEALDVLYGFVLLSVSSIHCDIATRVEEFIDCLSILFFFISISVSYTHLCFFFNLSSIFLFLLGYKKYISTFIFDLFDLFYLTKDLVYITTVSYTHLDVYKRQVL